MNLAAVFPPMPTPFRDDDTVDTVAIARNIAAWLRAGLGGVVALGTNGEAPHLDENESDQLIEAARDAVPATHALIVGTGRESTRATITASRRAAALGADAVLVRTPFFYKPRMTPAALVAHYTAVADAGPVPVLVYNYPALTGINIAAETLGRLAEHANIVGVKETGSDTAQVTSFVTSTPRGFAVMAGSMPTFYPSLCVGAAGGILAVACVAPHACVQLFEAFRTGRHQDALVLQQRLMRLATLVTTIHGVPGLKAAMDRAGYLGGAPRAPLQAAPASAIAEIEQALESLQLGREQNVE